MFIAKQVAKVFAQSATKAVPAAQKAAVTAAPAGTKAVVKTAAKAATVEAELAATGITAHTAAAGGARAIARGAGKAAKYAGLGTLSTAGVVCVENPMKCGMLAGQGVDLIIGDATDRPNCKYDPLGAWVCDAIRIIQVPCAYAPPIVGGGLGLITLLVFRRWEYAAIVGGGYVVYSEAMKEVGGGESCKHKGLINL